MNEAAVEYRENIRAFREKSYGIENALAKYVRNRWADKTIPHVQSEWGLTESEASKVVYAQASKNVLNKLLHHKRGGFGLFLRLLEDVTATKLEAYIEQQAVRAAHEKRTWEDEERRLALLQSRLSGGNRLGGRDA